MIIVELVALLVWWRVWTYHYLNQEEPVIEPLWCLKYRNIVDISIDPTVLVPNTLPTHGHNRRFCQLPVTTNSFGKSFFPNSIKIWNQLPTPIVNCNDLETFKLQLYNYSYS